MIRPTCQSHFSPLNLSTLVPLHLAPHRHHLLCHRLISPRQREPRGEKESQDDWYHHSSSSAAPQYCRGFEIPWLPVLGCLAATAWMPGLEAQLPPRHPLMLACGRSQTLSGRARAHGCSCARLLAACRSLASSRLLARVATFLLASLGRARPTTAHVRGSTLLGGARLWPLATCGSCSLLAPTNVTTGKQR